MLLLTVSMLFTNPVPLDMPRAEAYLSSEAGRPVLEDRFNTMDLWVSQAVDGRWVDDDGRVFLLAHLDVAPPATAAVRESTVTRTEYVASRVFVDRRDVKAVRYAVEALSPVDMPEEATHPRSLPRGFKDVDYWHGTNTSAIVCAFLPEKSKVWRLATWQLAEGDDFNEAIENFEDELFSGDSPAAVEARLPMQPSKRRQGVEASERELLRADARHSVAAYENWSVTDAPEFTILDDLGRNSSFVVAVTNDLPVMRAKYAETLPTEIDGSNVLCVARIFANRSEYEDAMEAGGVTNMAWSAAYWCQRRRELVAYRPPSEEAGSSNEELLKTFRHEAFHQYLSYAVSMMATSPWLNEGYAQFFEEGPPDPKRRLSKEDWEVGNATPEDLERFASMLPTLLAMDYADFYGGTDAERHLKYRLALSVALFIEYGARKVRLDPFKNLKRDYFKGLFETKDMRKATAAAFGSKDRLNLFVAEWLKFWKNT